MVSALSAENAESAEKSNERRDKLHLPEKAVPVDTSTQSVETLHRKLNETLQIGDRL